MKKRILAALLAALTALTALSAVTVDAAVEYQRKHFWYYIVEDGNTVTLLRYKTSNKHGVLTIPSAIGDLPVTALNGNKLGGHMRSLILSEKTQTHEVVIPDTVITIGSSAFYRFEYLTDITMSKNVTKIGDDAFYKCEKLREITIPDGVTTIGDGAFYDCDELKEIKIPDGVASIGKSAFGSCNFLSMEIPDNVTTLGENAFEECHELRSVTLGNGLNKIELGTFMDCISLNGITIPESVTEIGEAAFWNCRSLKTISIPAGVTAIGESAFWGCESLETVYFGGTSAEWNNIAIDEENESLDSATICYNHPAHSMTHIPTTATCIAGGTAGYYHCSLCGKDFLDEAGNDLFTGQTASALGHEGGEWTVTFPATCTAAGVETQFCTRCGDLLQTREVAALGHDHKPVSTTAPNCTEPGTVTYACSRCGDSYTVEGQTEPVHFFGDWTLTTAPTCAARGEETRYCARCGAIDARPVEPTEHNYTAWQVATWETCTTDGEETRRCTVCGSVDTRVLPATGHSFVNGYCEYCCDDDPTAPKLIVSDAWSKTRGDRVELNVSIVNNPGVSSLILGLSYDDSSLMLEDVENGELFDGIEDFNPWDGLGSVCFDSDSFVTGDGVLMTLTFTVIDDALPEWYDVGVYVRGAAVDENGDEIDFLWFEGVVDVNVYGDANEDGTVDVTDVILISQYILDNTADVDRGADADGDGAVDIFDVILISQYILDPTVVLGP